MKAGCRHRGGRGTLLAGMVVAVLGSAAQVRAQQAPDVSAKSWEKHIQIAATVSGPGAGDLGSVVGGETDLGQEGPWEVRGVPGAATSKTSTSGVDPGLDQTGVAPSVGQGSLTGATGKAVTDRATDPAIKPTGVELAPQRSTLEHSSFKLSGDGRLFGLDSWGRSGTSSFNF